MDDVTWVIIICCLILPMMAAGTQTIDGMQIYQGGCGMSEGSCPQPNYEAIDYFEDNCEQYYIPSGMSTMDHLTRVCNKELGTNFSAFK